eukprot:1139197-Pelagomonas_calceolata.AAC.8
MVQSKQRQPCTPRAYQSILTNVWCKADRHDRHAHNAPLKEDKQYHGAGQTNANIELTMRILSRQTKWFKVDRQE